MKTEELNFDLPEELIAQKPAEVRSQSRLLVLGRESGELADCLFRDIADYVNAGDCIVVNNTKVLLARFFARRQSGAMLEGLFLELQGGRFWHVMLKNSRKIKVGEKIILLDRDKKDYGFAVAAERCEDGTWHLDIESDNSAESVLEAIGFAPLPPYIRRPGGGTDSELDRDRYQTVYASRSGAVAAPTAGLHFTDELIDRLKQKGVRFANVTLHVGAGTFKPVTADDLADHEIHSERYEIDEANAEVINNTVKAGGRIIAVGTTSVRTLETVAIDGFVRAATGDTRLFILPGYQYKIVNAMVTNFHLPKSTLLALVGAFAGMDNVRKAYKHAIAERYRFFSFGDAMFIH